MNAQRSESLTAAYRARLDVLYDALRDRGTARTPELAATLGWTSHEVRGKLVVLKNDGRVIANGYGEWRIAETQIVPQVLWTCMTPGCEVVGHFTDHPHAGYCAICLQPLTGVYDTTGELASS